MAKKDREDIIASKKSKMKIVCPHCGRKAHFYAFEKADRQICNWCGKYVFKDKLSEFKYRTMEFKHRKERK